MTRISSRYPPLIINIHLDFHAARGAASVSPKFPLWLAGSISLLNRLFYFFLSPVAWKERGARFLLYALDKDIGCIDTVII